jgi:integrase
MIQQGQVFELKRASRERGPRWAYRYRVGGRGSRRVQRGGFASEEDAVAALERELERIRRDRRVSRNLTLAELVDVYLAQHDVQPVTIAKLRWLLEKAIAVFGERRIGELTSQEIAEWRMKLSPGYRFEATQALRQVLSRAVVWGMIDINPAKVGVDNPTPRRKEQRPFETWAEVEAVAGALGERYGPMILFAAATGLRPAEWVALEKRDIDRAERVVYVRRSFTRGELKLPKTEASQRAVPLQARARSCLPERGFRARLSGRAWWLPRRAPLSPLSVAPGATRSRHRPAPPGLRSSPHLCDFRASCRHLHLRPLALHGSQLDDDRPPLRPPRPRRP